MGCANPFAPPSCNDGVDNDGDGLGDLDDPDCGGSATSDGERFGSGDAGVPRDGGVGDAGDEDAGDRDGGDRDAGPERDAGPPRDGGVGDAGPSCSVGSLPDHVCAAQRRPTMCGESCVDLNSDATHCGDCETDCGLGGVCVHGRCSVCAEIGGELCGGRCTRPESDVAICSRTCTGDGCALNQMCVVTGGAGSPPRCEPATAGSRCNTPLALTPGAQTVSLVPQADLDATRPRCLASADPIGSSILVRVSPASSGVARVSVVGAGGAQISAQILEDSDCRCPAFTSEACQAGAGSATVSAPASPGSPIVAIITSDAPLDTVEVTLSIE